MKARFGTCGIALALLVFLTAACSGGDDGNDGDAGSKAPFLLGSSASKWERLGGSWTERQDGVFVQSDAEGAAIAVAGEEQWADYELRSSVALTGGEFQAGLLFRYASPEDYYYLIVRSESFVYPSPKLELFRKVKGIAASIGSADLSVPDRQAVSLRIEAAGDRLRVYAGDGERPLIDTRDAAITQGKAGVLTLMSEAEFGPTEVTPIVPFYTAPQPGEETDGKLWSVSRSGDVYDRSFTAPSPGELDIAGDAVLLREVIATSSVRISVLSNDRTVWPIEGTEAAWSGSQEEPGAYAVRFRLPVEVGDRVTFRIEGDSPDKSVAWNPSLSYGEMSSVPLHFRHSEHEIGDVHPYFAKDGALNMYYLRPGGGYEAALLTSRDMLRYEEASLTLKRDASVPPIKPWFVLGVFYDEQAGVYRSYSGTDGNVMRSAYSTDLQTWQAAGPEYDIPPQPGYSVQRDPYVFRNEDDGQYWAVMTCRKGGEQNGPEGSVCYAVSPDLKSWTGKGDLYAPGNIGDPEVPQMFKHEGKWYLIFSVYDHRVGPTTCLVADSPHGPWLEADMQLLDGEDLAAAQIAFPAGGRPLLFGWIPLRDVETIGYQHWGGDIALPRELVRRPNGLFDVRLPASVGQAIRGGRWPLPAAPDAVHSADGDREAVIPGRYDRFDLTFEWLPSATDAVGGVRIVSDGSERPVTVELDPAAGKLRIRSGEIVHSELQVELDSTEVVRARLIVEDDIVELFVNERYALAARLMEPVRQASLSLFDTGDAADSPSGSVFSAVELYRLLSRQELAH
ncbi:hypothetical protein B1A99_16045 [Cohnella sp. CIP 111063]|jgi:hypothetical protein|uniref:hypothetical protein n=1 Tax=unclassified Cohnella TaxID=2636738 RepID=UPI000B8C6642|nr:MULTISPECIES: hypothetical protein [unclassified Cohnella]OXS57571.1 hypothetical protein B1A99_16045 [Cohnella sp. CIP 111063]PRX70949.1 sucrose-6-phosphate hydrolase SacC (GH32 family) [Cohnella sp. SGD-V74]